MPNRDSPLRPSQSPRGGGQHFQQDHNIPSATSLKHLPGYKGHEPSSHQPQSSSKESASSAIDSQISKDLLDSVAALAKVPVWKSEAASAQAQASASASSTTPLRPLQASPSKTPVNVTDVTPEHQPGSIRRSLSVASDKDKTFEDLIKKVENSPKTPVSAVAPIKAKVNVTPKEPEVATPSHDTMSDPDKSDYDDMKGGVDYDDFDFEDEYLPRGRSNTASQRSSRSRRGRGVTQPSRDSQQGQKGGQQKPPLAKARPFKNRGRPKTKPLNIDAKNLEKVHRQVAGTDYDFEDEFDDEFGEAKEPEVSLKDLREQSKRQGGNVPIYMKGKEEKKDDEDDIFDNMLAAKNDIKAKGNNNSRKVGRGGGQRGGRGGRGGGRGRPRKETRTSSYDFDDDEDNDDLEDEAPVMEAPPKLPKLRLGAMLASSRKEKSKEDEVKVPKIKIKLGPKPDAKSEAVTEKKDTFKEAKTEDRGPPKKSAAAAAEAALAAEEKEEVKPSPASSPTKKGSRIESLAERLMGKTGSLTSLAAPGPSNDLESIFGPSGVPLDMSTSEPGKDSSKDSKDSSKQPLAENQDKSELDLLREELEVSGGQKTTSNYIQSSPAGASPHADTVYGPLKKAIHASKAALEKEKSANSASSLQQTSASQQSDNIESYDITRKHLKFKFKVDDRHSATSTPPPAPVSQPQQPQPQQPPSSAASAPSSHHRRMNRKKELLNQYYGHDIYPAPPSNGPTSSGSASGSMLPNSYDSLATYAGSSEPQPPRPVIKMPKAVASVTSVPTRADYQQQLEANLERKRKRDLGLGKNELLSSSAKGQDKGKKKRGRGAKNAMDDDTEYKPKVASVPSLGGSSANHAKTGDSEKARKTRGKPPKKCLADSPTHDEPDDFKAQSMRFAETIRAQFDDPKAASATSGGRGRKKKRKGGATEHEINSGKAPRLVIKISNKDVSAAAASAAAMASASASSNPAASKENGGRDEYDFEAEDSAPVTSKENSEGGQKLTTFVDGTVDSTLSSLNNSPTSASNNPEVKVAKLKIKI